MKPILLILGIIGNLFFFTSLTLASFSFTIPQTNINEDQEIEATINLALQGQGNKIYYLEGAIKKEGATNYFGVTWNDIDWVNYTSSNSEKSLKSITTNPEGSWSGVLKTKLDPSNSQFTGSGNYILKINRFTASGTSPTSSDNSITIAITALSTPAPTENPTDTSTNTPTPTKNITPSPTKTLTPTQKLTATPTKSSQKSTPTPSETSVNLPQSILGSSTTAANISPTPTKTEEKGFSFMNLIFIAGGIILILSGVLVFTFIAKGRFKRI